MNYDHNDIRKRIDAAIRLRGVTRFTESLVDDVIEIVRSVPIPMRLHCPECKMLHIDVEFATKPHHTHACQSCGNVWRPAVVNTVGVRFLPGFKDETRVEEELVNGQRPSEHSIHVIGTEAGKNIYECVCGAIGDFTEMTDMNHEEVKVSATFARRK